VPTSKSHGRTAHLLVVSIALSDSVRLQERIWYTPTPGDPYRPWLAMPQKFRDIETLSDFRNVEVSYFMVFDPPSALGPGQLLAPSPTSVDPQRPPSPVAKPAPVANSGAWKTAKPQVPPAPGPQLVPSPAQAAAPPAPPAKETAVVSTSPNIPEPASVQAAVGPSLPAQTPSQQSPEDVTSNGDPSANANSGNRSPIPNPNPGNSNPQSGAIDAKPGNSDHENPPSGVNAYNNAWNSPGDASTNGAGSAREGPNAKAGEPTQGNEFNPVYDP